MRTDLSQSIEERLHAALTAVGAIVWTNNSKGEMEDEQPEWSALTGQTLDQYQGYGWIQVVHPDDVPGTLTAWQTAVSKQITFVFQHRLKIKDGTWRMFAIRAIPLKNEDGSTREWVGVHTDITEKTQAEYALLESESMLQEQKRLYETVTNNTPDLIYVFDLDYRFTYANKALLAMWGKTWEESIGKSLLENGYEPWHATMHEREIDMVAVTKQNIRGEVSFPHATLGRRIYDYILAPVLNEKDEVVAVSGTTRDISDIRKSQMELKESESRFRNVIEQAPVAMLLSRGEGMVVESVNKPMLPFIHKISADEVLGKKLVDALPELAGQPVLDVVLGVLNTGVPFRGEEQPVDLVYNGVLERRYFNLSYDQIRDGNPTHAVLHMAVDVTEQVRSRRQIEESESKYRNLFEQMDQGVCLVEMIFNQDGTPKDYRFIEINPVFENQTGLKNATGKTALELVPNLERWWIEVYGNVAITGEPTRFTEGSVEMGRMFDVNAFRVGEKQSSRVAILFTDITEQRAAQNMLQYRKALLEAHNESNIDGVLLVDAKGKILSFNKRFIDIWNMPADIAGSHDDDAALGFAMSQLVHPAQFIEKVKWLYDHPDETSIDELEFKDGKIILRHGYPVVAEDGSYYAWSWVFRDITEQRNTENKIRESEKQFRLLADTMPQQVWTADVLGNLNYYNKAVFDYSGLSFEEINRSGWLQIVHPDDREENISQWMHSINTGEDFLFEHRFQRYDGQYRWQLSRAIGQRDLNGNIIQWVGSSTDIQLIKEDEQRKSDFIKLVSHELKTPVTSIKGYVQFLLHLLAKQQQADPQLSPVKSSLLRIDIQIVRLTRLITEMLDLSRIESGKLELQKDSFNFNELITETIQDILHTVSTHRITLQEDYHCEVVGDRDRLGQVLINFINNAIKYSPDSNQVNVRIYRNEKGQAAVTVQDFGIGINKEEQVKIFERFYRVEGEREETFSGFGIGLYIANEIIQRHGGSITVDSSIGTGSIFTFAIPLL